MSVVKSFAVGDGDMFYIRHGATTSPSSTARSPTATRFSERSTTADRMVGQR
jgi:hypothetical protein